MKLRLLLFSECNRRCRGCCNKDWDIDALPQIASFTEFDEILLTGGEPLLHPEVVLQTIEKIRRDNPVANIFLYTAAVDRPKEIGDLVPYLDGLTLTLHTQKDLISFYRLDQWLYPLMYQRPDEYFSWRLNIFKGLVPKKVAAMWKVKKDMTWIKNCPLPTDEVFMRL